MKILAGDIGGTHTRLILQEKQADGWVTCAENSYLSADYHDFTSVIKAFFRDNNIHLPIWAACFAVAGPVKSARASITNLPWVMSEEQLALSLQTPRVKLINDFVAVSHGIAELDSHDLFMLQQGEAAEGEHADSIVIGAGTGLGLSHRVWRAGQYCILPSESGHAGFAPANQLQTGLLLDLQRKHSHVSLEMLLSGSGLLRIYLYLCKACGQAPLDDIVQSAPGTDPAQLISQYALSCQDKICQQALDCFIDIYGAAAGDGALHHYPVDEVYIAGGIALKIKHKMTDGRFVQAFLNKAAMADNMRKIRIKLITQSQVGLYGALSRGRALYL